jgi:peroxiredoxin Q/BCP
MAPDFSLVDHDGNPVHLAGFQGRSHVVLVFYPGDDTGVCTQQLCEFRDEWDRVRSKGCTVLGVNPQSAESHRKFIGKYRYPFPLLVDKGKSVARLYNASGPVIRRTVYLIGDDGRIKFAQRGKPIPSLVLDAIS